MAFIW